MWINVCETSQILKFVDTSKHKNLKLQDETIFNVQITKFTDVTVNVEQI